MRAVWADCEHAWDVTICRDSQLLQDLGLTLKYMLNTHVHADHITGTKII
jgi:glyoxylase-like metal-dependent hydrolase (beta-lactamase superfamily II)